MAKSPKQRSLLLDAAIEQANVERAALALRLSDDPENEELLAEIQQLESVLNEYARGLERIRVGEAEAAKRNSAGNNAARRRNRQETKQHAIDTAASALAVGAKVETALRALAKALAEFDEVVRQRRAAASATVKGVHSLPISFYDNVLLNTGEITNAFAQLVVASGLCNIGPKLDPYVSIMEPSRLGPNYSLADSIKRANDKMQQSLEAAIAQIERKEAERGE